MYLDQYLDLATDQRAAASNGTVSSSRVWMLDAASVLCQQPWLRTVLLVALQNVFMLLRWGCNCVYDAIKSFGRSLRWPPRVLRSAVKLERAPPLETCVQGCRDERESKRERESSAHEYTSFCFLNSGLQVLVIFWVPLGPKCIWGGERDVYWWSSPPIDDVQAAGLSLCTKLWFEKFDSSEV